MIIISWPLRDYYPGIAPDATNVQEGAFSNSHAILCISILNNIAKLHYTVYNNLIVISYGITKY